MKAEAILEKVRYDFPETGKIVVGFSGGADSTLLTYLLLRRYGAERLQCVHVHHGIRGEEADRDAEFVRAFCAFHGVPLVLLKKDVPALAKASGEGVEECARRVRYAAFAETAGAGGSIATAHNADDNAETVLLNLTRGMGPRGACGIPKKRGNIYRPLLSVSRAEIEFLCGEFGLDFVTDSTNADTAYTRNHLRHDILPGLKDVNPRLTEAVAHFTQAMTLQQDYMRLQAENLLADAKDVWGLKLSVLRAAHPAVLRAALEMILREVGRLGYEHLLEAERCVRFGGSVSLPGGVQLTAKQDTATVTCGAEEALCVPVTGDETRLPDGRVLTVFEKFTKNGKNSGKVHNLLFNNGSGCDKITDTAVVRTRRSGDRFRPAGRGVGKSLKKLFNELRIPEAVRGGLLLLEVGGEIVWIESVGVAEGLEWLGVAVTAAENTDTVRGKEEENGKRND